MCVISVNTLFSLKTLTHGTVECIRGYETPLFQLFNQYRYILDFLKSQHDYPKPGYYPRPCYCPA